MANKTIVLLIKGHFDQGSFQYKDRVYNMDLHYKDTTVVSPL